MIVLILPAIAEEQTASDYLIQKQELQQKIQESQNLYKQPVSKKKIAKKFLLAMAGVAISSVALFLILTIYGKIQEIWAKTKDLDINKSALNTPDNLQDAIKIFLNKTDWDK